MVLHSLTCTVKHIKLHLYYILVYIKCDSDTRVAESQGVGGFWVESKS